MGFVNEKLIRFVLVALGVGALLLFAARMVDFVRNRDRYQNTLSSAELTEMRRDFRATESEATSGSHLLEYSAYQVIQDLNIYGYVPPVVDPELPVVTEKPGIKATDMEVPFIQFPNAAWIQPAGAQSDSSSEILPGDLYVVGDEFELESKRGSKLRLDRVELDKVVLTNLESEKEIIVRVTDMPINMKELLGMGGEADVAVAQRAAPERTEVDQTGVYNVGTKDLDDLGELSEEELLASVAVDLDRDELTNEPRGLTLRRINNPILTRMGLEKGDVVLAVNGEPTLSRDELAKRMREFEGESITVRIERLGGVRELKYRLPR